MWYKIFIQSIRYWVYSRYGVSFHLVQPHILFPLYCFFLSFSIWFFHGIHGFKPCSWASESLLSPSKHKCCPHSHFFTIEWSKLPFLGACVILVSHDSYWRVNWSLSVTTTPTLLFNPMYPPRGCWNITNLSWITYMFIPSIAQSISWLRGKESLYYLILGFSSSFPCHFPAKE